jgi:hypothetical protein
MSVVTLEGVVNQGQIRLKGDVRLPENTKVYVIITDMSVEGSAQIYSPRLAAHNGAKDFELELIEEPHDIGV